MTAALLPTTLSGCALFFKEAPPPPPSLVIPGDIKAEFNRLTPPPVKGKPLDKGATFKLIGKLRGSEVAKSQAGKRLIRMVEAYAANKP
jgi:hypothetical protein